MGRFGFTELLVILAIVLLLFGPKKLPELARSLGQAMKEFKKGQEDLEKTFTGNNNDTNNNNSANVSSNQAGTTVQNTVEKNVDEDKNI